jgi:hypothetical protein
MYVHRWLKFYLPLFHVSCLLSVVSYLPVAENDNPSVGGGGSVMGDSESRSDVTDGSSQVTSRTDCDTPGNFVQKEVTLTREILSRNRRMKKDRRGKSQPSRSENEPHLCRMKFAPRGNRTRDLALTSQLGWLLLYVLFHFFLLL